MSRNICSRWDRRGLKCSYSILQRGRSQTLSLTSWFPDAPPSLTSGMSSTSAEGNYWESIKTPSRRLVLLWRFRNSSLCQRRRLISQWLTGKDKTSSSLWEGNWLQWKWPIKFSPTFWPRINGKRFLPCLKRYLVQLPLSWIMCCTT